jgi:hypothetical protein
MWIYEALQEMDVVEIRTCSLKWINRSLNIHLSSLFDYLNDKTRPMMMGPRRVLTVVKDPIVIHVDCGYAKMQTIHKGQIWLI